MKILFVILLMIPLYGKSQTFYSFFHKTEKEVISELPSGNSTTKYFNNPKVDNWDYALISSDAANFIREFIYFKADSVIQVSFLCNDKDVIERFANAVDHNSLHISRNIWFFNRGGDKYKVVLREDKPDCKCSELNIKIEN